ncbi:hypothetical protein SD340_003631 [Vibrio fluvialis]|nr:hypothetical protein [Vibrio fluvialis]
MALSKSSLKDRIITELQGQGFTTTGNHAKADELATAIANAVVDEIQANAKANVTGGSYAGSWPIQ